MKYAYIMDASQKASSVQEATKVSYLNIHNICGGMQ